VLATAGPHLLPQLAAAFPQYHAAAGGAAAEPPQPAAASPQGGLAAGGAPGGRAALRPGKPMGEYVQCAAATEAAAALGLKASPYWPMLCHFCECFCPLMEGVLQDPKTAS
jgi:hypothetical protein